jgi:lipoprotein-anchoring transpeptidase ErfK/SrfK
MRHVVLVCVTVTILLVASGSYRSEAEETEHHSLVKAQPTAVSASSAPDPLLPTSPTATLILKADLTAQRLTVMIGGEIKHVWPISSGRRGYATPRGTFHPKWTARMWYSRQYDRSPMPHSVFFNRGVAFHGTRDTGFLGRPASHGCVRLAPANAAQLYALVHQHGYARTSVVVEGSPNYGLPTVVA